MIDDPVLNALDQTATRIERLMMDLYSTGAMARLNGLVAACDSKLEILRVRLLTAGITSKIDELACEATQVMARRRKAAPCDVKVDCIICDPLEEVAGQQLAEVAAGLELAQKAWLETILVPTLQLRAQYVAAVEEIGEETQLILGSESPHHQILANACEKIYKVWDAIIDLARAVRHFQMDPRQTA